MVKKTLLLSIFILSSAYAGKLERALERVHLDPSFKSEFYLPEMAKKVAVIDSGYDKDNTELKKVVDISNGFSASLRNGVSENESNSFLLTESFVENPGDENYGKQSSHGTHVSGIAAASYGDVSSLTESGLFKPVVPVKISLNRKGTENFIEALTRLQIQQDIAVINLSWSFGGKKGQVELDKKLEQAMLDVMEAGKIIVLSAGNNKALYNTDKYTKSIYELAKKAKGRLIVVGASEEKDNKEVMANFSAISDPKMAEYFITAPGVDIESFMPLSHNNSGKGEKSGTSMAAPLVAGAIARLVTDFPLLSIDTISRIVRETSDKQYRDNGTVYNRFGNGIMNIEAARKAAALEMQKLFPKKEEETKTNIDVKQTQEVKKETIIETPQSNVSETPQKLSWGSSLWNGINSIGSTITSGIGSAFSYIKSKIWG
jgi:subtilisin family serine protease